MATRTTHLLDNVGWHAMSGPQSSLADRNGLAGRYHLDVAPFSAVADPASNEAWADLAELAGVGHPAVLFAPGIQAREGWHVLRHFKALQMVAGDVSAPPANVELVDLTTDDVPEMLALVEEARPGPFSARTIEMGRYVGHRADGRLVAMAGERMHCDGFTEVSAVCTAADFRGRGLGAAVTLAVTGNIRARGDEAFLHVSEENVTAQRLYLELGFAIRRNDVDVLILRREDAS
jgi:ribosomal protein S18 acetylase RimI-like enzyme